MYSSQPELNNSWTKISYKTDQHKKKLKKKPNTPKEANTGSTKVPLPIHYQKPQELLNLLVTEECY
jgi:hypothetical protein